MIINANLVLSENQAVTATALSTNTLAFLDNGIVPLEGSPLSRNLGAGTPIPMLMQVTQDFATLTSLTITMESSDNENMSSSTVLSSSGAIPVADLVAGFRPAFTRHFPDAVIGKYFALRYTVAGSNATAGAITAAMATEVST